MDPQLQFMLLAILLLCCLFRDNSFGSRCNVVDFERPATVSITHESCHGSENLMCGYVEVRKGAYLFWSYYKSPHRVLSSEKPWPTVFYAVPAASSLIVPRNSTWLQNADLLVVDTPVGTGYSYEDDAISGNGALSWAQTSFPLLRQAFLQAAADVLVLLRALTGEIPNLQSSPLILLDSTAYGGDTYAGRISTVVGLAIRAGALNLTVTSGGLVETFDGRTTTTAQHQIAVDTRPRICLSYPPEPPIGGAEHNSTSNSLWYYVCL